MLLLWDVKHGKVIYVYSLIVLSYYHHSGIPIKNRPLKNRLNIVVTSNKGTTTIINYLISYILI